MRADRRIKVSHTKDGRIFLKNKRCGFLLYYDEQVDDGKLMQYAFGGEVVWCLLTGAGAIHIVGQLQLKSDIVLLLCPI